MTFILALNCLFRHSHSCPYSTDLKHSILFWFSHPTKYLSIISKSSLFQSFYVESHCRFTPLLIFSALYLLLGMISQENNTNFLISTFIHSFSPFIICALLFYEIEILTYFIYHCFRLFLLYEWVLTT